MTIFKEQLMVLASQNHWDSRTLEKDYHISRFLSQLPSWDSRLCLKGSLALTKVYLNNFRLCKDIDLWITGKPLTGRSQRLKVLEELIMKLNPLLQVLNLTGQCRILANARLLRVEITYPSLFSASQESFKAEIILRDNPVQVPKPQEIKHFYEGIGSFKLPVISLQEEVVEKLIGALHKDRRFSASLRDVYDLWQVCHSGFNFKDKGFIKLFKQRLIEGGNKVSRSNWSLNAVDNNDFEESLRPYIKQNEVFDYSAAVLALNQKFFNLVFGLTMAQYSQMVLKRYQQTFEDLLRL